MLKLNEIYLGDSAYILTEMEDNSIDSIVTDPPYGIKFMNQKWDYSLPSLKIWKEIYRVLKPGGHLLSFGGTRTYHRLVVDIEGSGFEIRDQLIWLYGNGFPKGQNISKTMSKKSCDQEDIRIWEGWNTSLKPAYEPIVLARKSLSEKTIVDNILKWNTGGINIDACRVPGKIWKEHDATGLAKTKFFTEGETPIIHKKPHEKGRWPTNLIHDDSDIVLDSLGSAARFFYCAKVSSKERGKGNNCPTVKPITLLKYLIRLITPVGGVVLDPFLGSGSTILAAIDLNFNWVGVEKEDKIYQIAKERISGKLNEK